MAGPTLSHRTRKGRAPSGILTSYTFARKGAPPAVFSASSGDNGNLYQVSNNLTTSRTQNFTYDSLNRISQAYTTGTNWGETYTLDPWENLYQRALVSGKTLYEPLTCQANTANQLTTCSMTYDGAGNMISNGSASYTYDDENRITSTAGYTYKYDGDGKRVEKSSGSTGTLYWPRVGSDTLSESDLSGNISADYAFFNGMRVARRDVPSNTVHFYMLDQLGTTRMVLTPTSATAVTVDEDADYYPYGGEIVVSGSSTATHYKFTGKERDAESDLDYFGARHYGSSLGRFMVPDDGSDQDAADPQSWNLYGYVRNNPLTNVDPDGHGCLFYTNIYGPDNQPLGVEGYFCTDQLIQFTDQLVQSTKNFIAAPRDPGCMASKEAGGAAIGTAGGALAGGIAGIETGPGAALTAYGGGVAGGAAGGFAGGVGGLFTCMTGNGGGSGGGSGGSGSGGGNGGSELSSKAKRKLGNLAGRAGEKVRDVIRSRGGSGANVNEVGQWADRTLGEAAEAAEGDPNAEKAVKIAKQAGRLGQQY